MCAGTPSHRTLFRPKKLPGDVWAVDPASLPPHPGALEDPMRVPGVGHGNEMSVLAKPRKMSVKDLRRVVRKPEGYGQNPQSFDLAVLLHIPVDPGVDGIPGQTFRRDLRKGFPGTRWEKGLGEFFEEIHPPALLFESEGQ